MATEITRKIPQAIQSMLWGKAAGRCQFAGCNQPLWKSAVTREQVNIAQKAHIYAFSAGGPRAKGRPKAIKLNNLNNLILVCHGCHRKIDKDKDGGRYTAELLKAWKSDHEQRVERVTGIHPKRASHIVLYGANVGKHSSPLNHEEAAEAMFPLWYPAEDQPINLGTVDSSKRDSDPNFWVQNGDDLVAKFNERVRPRLADGNIKHLSVFALAPQPLLILLGTLVTDIQPAVVYQRHREPQSWKWRKPPKGFNYIIRPPEDKGQKVAVVFSLSASVADDRITQTLGKDVAIWELTMSSPHNDFLKSREQLSMFRTEVRRLLNEIKGRHCQSETLHIFPAMPVSAAVELGRVRQPKADMPWQVYDQVNERGGFVPALKL